MNNNKSHGGKKRVIPGVNDLCTTHPELMSEWDFDHNSIKPNEIHCGSHKKVWWKCKKCGNAWETEILLRANLNRGCPYCANQKLAVGFNDFGTLCPNIYNDWDYDSNGGKTPSDFIGVKSNKTIYLKCALGHKYETKVYLYYRGDRCPYCGNKRILSGFNDLATTCPRLVEQWDYEKNTLTPKEVTTGSDKKVWWKCEKGHSWQATINSRYLGRGCPECLKEQRTSLGEKTFAFYMQHNFKDFQENVHLKCMGKFELDMYVPSLKLAVEYDGQAWHRNTKRDLEKDELCKKNNITLIRLREEGCPKYETTAYLIDCPRNKGNVLNLKDSVNSLFVLINHLFNLDIKNIDSLENDITAINENYYSYTKRNSIKYKCPRLMEEWDYEKNKDLNPEFISVGSNSKVWWKCKEGHSWPAVVVARVRGNGCPYCSGTFAIPGVNDLATLYPDLMSEWDFDKNKKLNPGTLTVGSPRVVWWKCKYGHAWRAQIFSRTKNGSGCPTCAGQRSIPGVNDLATKYPELVKEWDYEKNGDLKPSDCLPQSEKVVWWICPKGHSYDMPVFFRTKAKSNCIYCSNKRILKGYNDLETLHPELAKEWNYEKNNGLLPSQVGGGGGSHKKVWWICPKGHEWPATLSSRIRLHTGCPTCAIERNRKHKIK